MKSRSITRPCIPILLLGISALSLASCTPATDSAADRAALLAADQAFAEETKNRGQDGWMAFYTADAVRLLMGGSMAESSVVQGHEAIRRFDADLFSDPSNLLVWEPTEAGVFQGGDFGFTTGRSAFLLRAGEVYDTLSTGQYVTLWRRASDGSWQVVLDTGAQDP